MERVTSLFKSFRNNEIAYDELFGTLTQMLSENPQFAAEAIATLDNAQQLTPIPVTDFIQLRSQMETTADTFRQQYVANMPADNETTKLFNGSDTATLANAPSTTAPSYDPTLIAAPTSTAADLPGEATATAQPVAEDYADEATVIMPMPPRHDRTTPVSPPAVSAGHSDDEHATLVATLAPTLAPASASAAAAVPTATASTNTSPTSLSEPAAAEKHGKKPPLALLAGIGGLALIMLLALVLWPSDREDADAAATNVASQQPKAADSPWQSSSNPSYPAATSAEQTGEDNAVLNEPQQEQPMTEPASWEEETADMTESQTDTEFFDSSDSLAMDSTPVEEAPVETAPTAVKDEAYYLKQIKAAVASDHLTPASEEGTATWYLAALIRYDENSDRISDARTLISQRHLELAKKAREKNQWDAAQQHLDDALKVRLPDSYLP